MITAGIDLSSKPSKTASCVIDWSARGATVIELIQGVDDDAILALASNTDKVGIDAPFGWPTSFVNAVGQNSIDGSWPADYSHADNKSYRLRRTDLWVWSVGVSPPLSVSTDRIAIPAMRVSGLLSRLPNPTARDGSGVVVEVYPAVALHRWGFPSRGYKRAENARARQSLVTRFFEETTSWLSVRDIDVEQCSTSDDAFDSLIAALVARAAAQNLVDQIPEDNRNDAAREGWIAVPVDGSLKELSVG